jgi:hypothetical protein
LNLGNAGSCVQIEERLGRIIEIFMAAGENSGRIDVSCDLIYESIARIGLKELPAGSCVPIVMKSGPIVGSCTVIGAS